MACDVALLQDIKFFEVLDADDRKDLASVINYSKISEGDTLFHAGEPGDSLYVVRTGEVELFVKDTAGQRIVLTIAKQGDLFGELALLDAGSRTATALALAETELLEMDRDGLMLLFKKNPDTALHMLAAMGTMIRKADELLRTRVAKNVNEEEEELLTFGQRVADRVAEFGGSWTFIISFAAFLLAWMCLNLYLALRAFDSYPFILLNLVLSTLAALQAPVIMMSQNRQASKDRLKADLDYEVNLKAELEVAHLHEKVDRVYESMLERFKQIEKTLKQAAPGAPASS
jgi:uncharacterized membrane protein